ncbi:uncharacterized protein LOC132293378 isoform X2 [Cornus florida]|nr:uncharacterized protein LOC132293378 isoform X2 [Cornus florida]
MDKMDINGKNCHFHERQPSRCSKNVNENKSSTEKDVHNSYINHAEIDWHERRRAWIGDRSQRSLIMPREPIVSWTTAYEDLLLSTEAFHQPIPLAEMVDFLVDIWYEEGLYD